MVFRAYRYRLKVTPEVERQLVVNAGHARFVWNHFLHNAKVMLGAGERIPSYSAWSGMLPALKREYPFLGEADSQALQQKLKDLREALSKCFRGEAGFPRFKKKFKSDSYRLPQHIEVDNRHAKLGKAGLVRFYRSRKIPGNATIRSATISREADGWYVSILTQLPNRPVRHEQPDSMVGGDLGVTDFIALSNGETVKGRDFLRAAHTRLVKLQRDLVRKKKGSSNYRKQFRKLAKAHKEVRDARHDFLRKLAVSLCKNHALVALEDLRVNNMTKTAKGSIENPGRNVKAKSGLNRAILDQGWGVFRTYVEQEAAKHNSNLVLVNPRYSSQECSNCGYTANGNRVAKRFHCEACDAEKDADLNAAVNILNRGLKSLEGRLTAA